MLDNILNRVRPERKYDKEELAQRLPPGQSLTEKWPVLHYGGVPHPDLKTWTFRVFGLVENPTVWTYDDFMALPHGNTENLDIHCVTRWSKFDNVFEGIPFKEVYDRVRPKAEAKYVMVHAEQGFTTNVPLADLLHPTSSLRTEQREEPHRRARLAVCAGVAAPLLLEERQVGGG